MDIRKLEVFCKVVELKSFTRAAEAVLLSQPTVSENIRGLEEELGHKLIDRLGRTAEPTPVGCLLYDYAGKILRLQHETLQALERYSGRLIGRIMIGAGTIPGTYILPGLIGGFRRKYSSIQATLRIAGSRLIAREVLNGELEIGVIGACWNEKGLQWREIFADELALVVHSSHPWAGRREVALMELRGKPFILREKASGTRQVIHQILERHGLKPAELKEVAEIGSSAAVKQAVRAGLGMSILSKRAVEQEVRCGELVSIAVSGVQMKRSFYLIRRKNRELSPLATVFLEFLLQKAGIEVSSDSAGPGKD